LHSVEVTGEDIIRLACWHRCKSCEQVVGVWTRLLLLSRELAFLLLLFPGLFSHLLGSRWRHTLSQSQTLLKPVLLLEGVEKLLIDGELDIDVFLIGNVR
jgi:hypothetical protein